MRFLIMKWELYPDFYSVKPKPDKSRTYAVNLSLWDKAQLKPEKIRPGPPPPFDISSVCIVFSILLIYLTPHLPQIS
jgi:hypothetical protein